jgi:hypothetical protein
MLKAKLYGQCLRLSSKDNIYDKVLEISFKDTVIG